MQQVLQNWKYILGNATSLDGGFIVLEHDLFQQTVEVATGYILPDALAHNPKFTIQPVITCLNKPMQDAYIETNDNKTNPQPANSGASSVASWNALLTYFQPLYQPPHFRLVHQDLCRPLAVPVVPLMAENRVAVPHFLAAPR